MSIIEIPLNDFAKVAPFRDIDNVRHYLGGVYIEPVAEGCMLVATNGHVIAALHSRGSQADQARILSVSTDLADAARNKLGSLSVADADARAVISEPADGKPVEHYIQPGAAFIDGKFPNWRKVIPSPTSLRPNLMAHIATRYLLLACSAVANTRDDGRYTYLSFWCASEKPEVSATVVRYSNCPELIVAVMPVRAGAGEAYWPDWMTDAIEKATQVQP
jgi:hypothetical protein